MDPRYVSVLFSIEFKSDGAGEKMDKTIQIEGKPVKLHVTRSALKQIDSLLDPICVEMELYFSCLIRKRVLFHPGLIRGFNIPGMSRLYISFRPVMTSHCRVDNDGDDPPLTDFPINNAEAFIPRWLTIDYRKGKWLGEFGY